MNTKVNLFNEFLDKSIEELRAEDYKLFKTLNLPD
jgi:hypothetical protein